MRKITWVQLSLAAVGCSQSTGPVADLSGLRSTIASINTVVASPLSRSLGYFQLVPVLPTPAAGAPLLPDPLLGKTFTFSCASQRYGASADSGAPANGVRIILYLRATDGSIACPATPAGQLDLFDASTPDTAAVRGVASGPGGGEPLVAYTISHAVTDAPGVARATGFVSDGQLRLNFQVSEAAALGSHAANSSMQIDDSAAAWHAVLDHNAQMGVDTYSDGLDLTVQHAAESAELKGSATWFNTYRSWNEVVSIDDVPFAKVAGTLVPEDQEPTITPLGGRLFFTSEQHRVLLDFVNAPDVIRTGLGGVLGAGAHLVPIPL